VIRRALVTLALWTFGIGAWAVLGYAFVAMVQP
jgi:hypothetical protein